MIHFPNDIKGPFLGSPPAYCSVAAARQGTAIGLSTKIGPDMPQDLLQPLIKAGVDIAGIQIADRTTTTELIYNDQGHKEIRYPTKASPIKVEDIPESYRGCRMIYVCPMDNDVLLNDLAHVVALGQVNAVDLGGYGGVHMSLANRQAVDSLVDLACGASEHFNIVKASDEDTATIFDWDNPDAAAERFLDCGPEVVVITMGARGVRVYTAGNRWHVPPLPGRVIDTTGGGDTFMAGFLSEYLRSANPLRAAQWGCATAICVIEQSGGVRLERMPTHQQVQDRVDQGYQSGERKGIWIN
jgi:sugar/nucleoside kinase (ribokinase family)